MMRIFSVYDVKAEIFQKPFTASKIGEAMRGFTDVVKDKNHALGQHPEDYSLFEIGNFDEKIGEVDNIVNFCCLTGIEAARED